MSRHDAVRLEKGMSILADRPTPTDEREALLARRESVLEGIGALQSTDDPSPIYAETHDALQLELREVEERLAAIGGVKGAWGMWRWPGDYEVHHPVGSVWYQRVSTLEEARMLAGKDLLVFRVNEAGVPVQVE